MRLSTYIKVYVELWQAVSYACPASSVIPLEIKVTDIQEGIQFTMERTGSLEIDVTLASSVGQQ